LSSSFKCLFCGSEVRFHPANLDHQFFRATEDPLTLINLGPIILLHLRSFSNVKSWNLGYFQDNITISLHCKKDRAATLSSHRVENVEVVKRTITNNASSSYKWECNGEIVVPFLGVQAGGGDGETTETGSSSALEIPVTLLSSFYVNQTYRPGCLVFNLFTQKKLRPALLMLSRVQGN